MNSAINIFDEYLKEISQIPLLSAREEISLSKKIANKDKEAKDLLITSNLRLVVSIAKRFSKSGVELQDLVQEGNLGLMKASEKFDYKKGCRFSTYATIWIMQSITRAIADKARTIRIPVHMIEKINKLNKARKNIEENKNAKASTMELAEYLGITKQQVNDLIKYENRTISLDTPVGEQENICIKDYVIDENAKSPLDAVEEEFDKKIIKNMLSTLPEREKYVLMLRYGFYNNKEHTLEEIGKKLNVTRERIRQIEKRALSRLEKGTAFTLLDIAI